MRIGIDVRKLHDYGIGTYVRNLLTHLDRLDHETEYVLLCRPEQFRYFYVFVMTMMMIIRAYTYESRKWAYFMYDFCYFANVLSIDIDCNH